MVLKRPKRHRLLGLAVWPVRVTWQESGDVYWYVWKTFFEKVEQICLDIQSIIYRYLWSISIYNVWCLSLCSDITLYIYIIVAEVYYIGLLFLKLPPAPCAVLLVLGEFSARFDCQWEETWETNLNTGIFHGNMEYHGIWYIMDNMG